MMKYFYLAIGLFLSVLWSGCQTDVMLVKRSPGERSSYIRWSDGDRLHFETQNLLANLALTELFFKQPDAAIQELYNKIQIERRDDLVFAAADIALACAQEIKDLDLRSRYYLTAAFFSYLYISVDDETLGRYSERRIYMIKVYNQSVTELFDYFRKQNLLFCDSFQLSTINKIPVKFAPPEFNLPHEVKHYKDFLLCADYKLNNLTHVTHQFGLGVPLIALSINSGENDVDDLKNESPIPATFLIRFYGRKEKQRLEAKMYFLNVRASETVKISDRIVPLATDFSSPLAYITKYRMLYNRLEYAFNPALSENQEGLYLSEPFDEKKIPVLFVHGLMSNRRTWIQMLNTLQNDPMVRRHFQFMGFTYASGNPVVYSSYKLRNELQKYRNQLIKNQQSTENFDRMVVIGHSMGGLLCKTLIQESDESNAEKIIGIPWEEFTDKLSETQKNYLRDMMIFSPQNYIKRVIFISVPHRGSRLANTFFARWISSLIKLPKNLIYNTDALLAELRVKNRNLYGGSEIKQQTGVDNLDPNNFVLKVISDLPMSPEVPLHSIIGNQVEGGVLGGSDGVVDYSSAHLDNVASELVVKSGHSAQEEPLAILEVRRILLLHLSDYLALKQNERTLETADEK